MEHGSTTSAARLWKAILIKSRKLSQGTQRLSHFITIIVIFRAIPCSMWDLSLLTSDQACAPAVEVQTVYHWTTRKSPDMILKPFST